MTTTMKELIKKSNKNTLPKYAQRRAVKFGDFSQVIQLQALSKVKQPTRTPKSNFNRVMYQLKNLAARNALITHTIPKSNFKRVMAQLKTNAYRKAYDERMGKPTSYIKVKLIAPPGDTSTKPFVTKPYYGPVVEPVTHITLKKHTFSKHPSVRKGRLGEVLSFEERRKRDEDASARNLKKKNEFLARGYTIEDWLFNEAEVNRAMHEDDLDLTIPEDEEWVDNEVWDDPEECDTDE